MKIRVINASDWERTYEFDKSIIRVGSQISCDIQLSGNDIQPMMLQIVRSGGKEIKYTMRIFADNVKISRGEQTYAGQQMVPYDVLDGDKLICGSYRLNISLDDEQTRVRSTKNMEAKMYMQKRELSLDSPINGVLRLKNTGTERACQFRMQIRGLPDECLQTAPLPYLYPGGKSTVGFLISHLQTKPSPGFHTVSIQLTAPNEYFGEVLEFRQDIYVNPVFKTEMTLEDDSAELSGFNKVPEAETKKQEETEPQQAAAYVPETARMIPGQAVIEKEETDADAEKEPVVISGTSAKNVFDETDDDEESSPRRRRSNRKQKVNVIHHNDDENVFEDEDEPEETEASAEEPELAEDPEMTDEITEEAPEFPAEPEEIPVKAKRSTPRKKKTAPAADERDADPAAEPEEALPEIEPAAGSTAEKTGWKLVKKQENAFEDEEKSEKAPAEPETASGRELISAAAESECEPAEKQNNAFEEDAPEETAVSAAGPENTEPAEKTDVIPEEAPAASGSSEAPESPAESEIAPEKPKKTADRRKKKAAPETEEKAEVPEEMPAEPESKPGGEQNIAAEEPETAPVKKSKKSASRSERKPAKEAVMPAAEPEPMPGPAEKAAEPVPADLQDTDRGELRPERSAEGPEISAAEPEPQIRPKKAKKQPKITADEFRETETVSETAEEPEKPGEEKSEAKPEKKVITGSGNTAIPVVDHNDLFDFSGEEEAPEAPSEKQPEVRFVKRGSFDE